MLLDIKQTGSMPVNTYILKDEFSKEAVVIDVGGDFEIIKTQLEAQGFKIKFILNTHGHFDHVLGEIEAKQNYPEIPIYMSEKDISHIINLKEEMHFLNFKYQTQSLKLDKFIDENSNLYIGGQKITIFETPGHSAGGLSFHIDGKLFSGDTLFCRSIGRTDFYDGDFDILINSIKSKLLVLPDSTLVFPGHGSSSTIQNEKKFNEFLK